MAAEGRYVWLVVVGALGAFGFGWGTGANDVANAFGTSVGSKTLTLKQAVIIAAVFEFAGALLLGRVVTNTIAGGIASVGAFQREPEIYSYGMCCALGVGTIWLVITSYLGLNVSSTHSIIGAIIGFSLVYNGVNGVAWSVPDPGSFPPVKGVVSIVLAWFIAPILTGLVSAIFFLLVRSIVLRRKHAYTMSFWMLPIMVFITVWVNVYFVLTKGAKKTISPDSHWSDALSVGVAAAVAGGVAILVACFVLPFMKKKVDQAFTKDGTLKETLPMEHQKSKDVEIGSDTGEKGPVAGPDGKLPSNSSNNTHNPLVVEHKELKWYQKASRAAMHGMNVDIHHRLTHDDHLREIHDRAEVFPPQVEYSFKYLQVFSAICVIFAHGAGEVGYMAGPLATIWDIYQTGNLNKSVSPPIWIILIGAFGLVIGLATYGYNVTRAMGVQLAKLTATRGFCAELATSFTIMIASQYGLPTSSSQCITGAVVGIGIAENLSFNLFRGKDWNKTGNGVNWRQFARQFASWVATLFIVGLGTAALFSQGVYSPSIPAGKDVMLYEDRIQNLSTNLYKDFNTTLLNYSNASASGVLVNLPPAQWTTLNDTINKANTKVKAMHSLKQQTVNAKDLISSLYKSLALYQQNTVLTLGQNTVFPGANVCNNNLTHGIAANTTAACMAPKMLPTAYATKFP